MMKIEESLKQSPEKFEKIFDNKTEDILYAFKDMSQKLDVIIWGVVAEYAQQERVEANIFEVTSYKTLNKIITAKLDKLITEFLAEKRKNYNVE